MDIIYALKKFLKTHLLPIYPIGETRPLPLQAEVMLYKASYYLNNHYIFCHLCMQFLMQLIVGARTGAATTD